MLKKLQNLLFEEDDDMEDEEEEIEEKPKRVKKEHHVVPEQQPLAEPVAPAPVQPAPEVMETPAPPVMDGPISFGGMNTVNTAPVMPNMGAPVMNSNLAPQMMGNSDMLGQTNTMAMPNVNNQMPNPQSISNINYADLKETFMKSCENMFDALVKRFENK